MGAGVSKEMKGLRGRISRPTMPAPKLSVLGIVVDAVGFRHIERGKDGRRDCYRTDYAHGKRREKQNYIVHFFDGFSEAVSTMQKSDKV